MTSLWVGVLGRVGLRAWGGPVRMWRVLVVERSVRMENALLSRAAVMWGSRNSGRKFDAYASLALLEGWVLQNLALDLAVHGVLERLHCFHMAFC